MSHVTQAVDQPEGNALLFGQAYLNAGFVVDDRRTLDVYAPELAASTVTATVGNMGKAPLIIGGTSAAPFALLHTEEPRWVDLMSSLEALVIVACEGSVDKVVRDHINELAKPIRSAADAVHVEDSEAWLSEDSDASSSSS